MIKSKTTFLAFVKRYERYRATRVRYASRKQVEAIANAHMGEMKDKSVADVFTRSFLTKWRNNLFKTKETSIGYRNRMISCVRSMAKQAYAWKLIGASALRDASAVLEPLGNQYAKKTERKIYSRAEIEQFLAVIENEDERFMFDMFAYLGCRIGEFLGLTWDCVSDEGYIQIKQQCTYEGKGKWLLTPVLKTNESYRACPIPSRLMGELKKRRIKGHGKYFIFSMKKDHRTPYGETTFRKKVIVYADMASLPRLTPHCFRHSKATMLLEVCKNMEEVKSAARFLGHSATMLLDTYGHAKEETMLDILSRLE